MWKMRYHDTVKFRLTFSVDEQRQFKQSNLIVVKLSEPQRTKIIAASRVSLTYARLGA
jgi:hypothetical protein